MGRSADPRRAAEARIRTRGGNSFEVHDPAPWTAIAELAAFLRNYADAIAAIDLCVIPTLTFERLFAFLVVGHGRRAVVCDYPQSVSRVASATDRRGIPVEHGAQLFGARQ